MQRSSPSRVGLGAHRQGLIRGPWREAPDLAGGPGGHVTAVDLSPAGSQAELAQAWVPGEKQRRGSLWKNMRRPPAGLSLGRRRCALTVAGCGLKAALWFGHSSFLRL